VALGQLGCGTPGGTDLAAVADGHAYLTKQDSSWQALSATGRS